MLSFLSAATDAALLFLLSHPFGAPAAGLRCPVLSCAVLCSIQLADPWERAQDLLLQGTVSDGVISGFNKGGVLVDLGDIKGEAAWGGGRG